MLRSIPVVRGRLSGLHIQNLGWGNEDISDISALGEHHELLSIIGPLHKDSMVDIREEREFDSDPQIDGWHTDKMVSHKPRDSRGIRMFLVSDHNPTEFLVGKHVWRPQPLEVVEYDYTVLHRRPKWAGPRKVVRIMTR